MRKISLIALLLLTPVYAFAADAQETTQSDWVLNIRRIGLDLSKTSVENAAAYADSPIAVLKAADQELFKGIGDIALEYKKDKLSWNNSVFTEYGKTTLKPYNDVETSNENADKLLLSSDVSYACWSAAGFKFGPTGRLQYETEYTANGSVPRQNIARANAGFAVFDHPIVKDLHVAGVYEYDFTYSGETVSKLAAEFGWRLEYQLREGVKLSTDGYYREYLDYSMYVGTDLERDLSAVGRLDTNLWGDFTMGPYVQYRLAKSREADVYGSNFIVGISFSYITKFGL